MQGRQRDRFSAEELAIVLSHYDLGIIESVTEFNRGSRRSPKVGLVCQRGKFLLKKRARSRGGPDRVYYVHSIQHHLADACFPLPRLIKPRDSEETIVCLENAMYELFDYVSGHPYSGIPAETRDAGRVLARFHQVMEGFNSDQRYSGTGYHDALAVQTGLNAVPTGVSSHESAAGKDAEVLGLTNFLFEAYTDATEQVDSQGYGDWPDCMTHSDWHPGNLLFKRQKVLAVIDYDCAKIGKSACDVANGTLQFSMTAGSEPEKWPDHLDIGKMREFLSGYREFQPISEQAMKALPYLMIEALVAESVLPIAATGSFGPFDGFGFLQMVRRKVRWIQDNLAELQNLS